MTSEEARQQAQAEGLTLRLAESTTGYFGVRRDRPGQPKPYQAQVSRGGKTVSLGCFATAEEAALCVARSPEGQAAAARKFAAVPLTSEEARQQAQAEKLTLRLAESTTGYFGVYHAPGQLKPYMAKVRRGGKQVMYLGRFATAEEAALCVARSPEGQAAAKRPAAAVSLTSEEARQQAQAEGLTLRVAESKTGYFGVSLKNPGQPKPYQARVHRGDKPVSLGMFVTAQEAALHVARSPEAQAAMGRAAAAESQDMSPVTPSGASLKEDGTVPPLPPCQFVKEEGSVPPLPPDALVNYTVEVVGEEEEEGSDGRPKKQRTE